MDTRDKMKRRFSKMTLAELKCDSVLIEKKKDLSVLFKAGRWFGLV